ncbi:MAG: SGNH/GDSL hydrolase family protein [Clostridia bacterium]|nr:SGNH/GDSL hydrolase family protein [Clostridia bacterium]
MNTVYLFGDSVIKGVTFSAEKNSYSLHRRDICLQNGDAKVVNRGVFGATAPKVFAELSRRLPEDVGGDAVVLSFGGNDSDHDWASVSASPEGVHGPKIPVKEFEKLFSDCVECARRSGARVLVSSLIPIDAGKYMERISRGLSRENILRWLGSENMLYRWHEHYDCVVRNLAVKLGVELVDLREPFLLSHDFGELLSADGIHPTEKGHRIIDSTLSAALGA